MKLVAVFCSTMDDLTGYSDDILLLLCQLNGIDWLKEARVSLAGGQST
jgi:hypothetical protein